MSKSFWAIIAIIVVVFGGILLIKQDKAGAPSNGAQATNHIQGEGKTGVTLVEYGDYQCPFCGSYYPILKSVQEKYNDQIYFQFRNLPLSQQHKNAFAAARAAEAAGLQNKFWEMHDLIYANQNVWTPMDKPEGTFEQYATQLGLNLGQFKSDASSTKVNDAINADVAAYEKTGERIATPAFLLDGKKINATSVEEFSKLIDEAIAKKAEQQ